MTVASLDKIYGTKISFHRFVNTMPPSEVSEQLLYNIMFRRIYSKVNRGLVEKTSTDDEKFKFLSTIRNAYMHKAKNTGSPDGGEFAHWHDPVIINGMPKKGR